MMLAERLRPSIDNLECLLGPAKKIWERDFQQWLKKNKFHFVLWGPPGSGKTTLIKTLCQANQQEFVCLSAVRDGVKEIRQAVHTHPGKIVFIDEIHRLSASQQDTLLPILEQSEAWILGATTQSPTVSLSAPILSRIRNIYVAKLTTQDILQGLKYALEFLKKNNNTKSNAESNTQSDTQPNTQYISDERAEYLLKNTIPRIAKISGGDLRFSLNLFDNIVSCNDAAEEENIYQNTLKSFSAKKHYDYISAMIKSMRGSDPDAALFYAVTSLDEGEDPLFLLRRCMIFASEDVGNADPNALAVATSAFTAVQNVGMPEGVIPLAQCVTYLASTLKSNRSYMAIKKVREWRAKAEELGLSYMPPHELTIRGSSDYKYPHDSPNSFVSFQYLPNSIQNFKAHEKKSAYLPKDEGVEGRLLARLAELWKK